ITSGWRSTGFRIRSQAGNRMSRSRNPGGGSGDPVERDSRMSSVGSRRLRLALTHVDLPNESNGGVAHQVHSLANALSDRGHSVTVFTFSPKFDRCRYDVRQFPAPRLPRKLYPFSLAWNLARTNFSGFDVVHAHGDNFLMWRVH